MIDEEVEIVLREIRERVRAVSPRPELVANELPVTANGDGELTGFVDEPEETETGETLARLEAYLMTTARAWDQLPPIVSNRSGARARLELWIKAKARMLARWFTWEQVNFNAAVHHAMRDTTQTLSDHDAALRALRNRLRQEIEGRQRETAAQAEARAHELAALTRETEALAGDVEEQRNEIQTLRAAADALRAELKAETESQQALINNQRSEINLLRAEVKGESETRRIQSAAEQTQWQALADSQAKAQAGQLAQLAAELRESVEKLQSEQRVLFKQVSLESSEAAAFQATTRRKVEAALDELNQRMEQLEQALQHGK